MTIPEIDAKLAEVEQSRSQLAIISDNALAVREAAEIALASVRAELFRLADRENELLAQKLDLLRAANRAGKRAK